jgi:hypothetical protein
VAIAAQEANPSVHVRALGADRLLGRLQGAQGPAARALKSAAARVGLRRLALTLRRRLLYTRPKPVEQALEEQLRVRFEPEVRALSEYLGRDLVTLWGYDRLA